jgi:hypothetical protein
MARRLVDELAAAATEATEQKDDRRAAQLGHARRAMLALNGVLGGHVVAGRRRDRVVYRPGGGVQIGPDERGEAFTADELTALLWDALSLGFSVLAEWRGRARPA